MSGAGSGQGESPAMGSQATKGGPDDPKRGVENVARATMQAFSFMTICVCSICVRGIHENRP